MLARCSMIVTSESVGKFGIRTNHTSNQLFLSQSRTIFGRHADDDIELRGQFADLGAFDRLEVGLNQFAIDEIANLQEDSVAFVAGKARDEQLTRQQLPVTFFDLEVNVAAGRPG